MPEALSITAPLLVAVVLLWSAIGKLRDPSAAAEGFAALGVPRALSRPWLVRAHPWVEVALAGLLVAGPGWLGMVGALGALGLMLAYLVLVGRAVARGDDVDCACFGAWGPGRVTARTVLRNGWLVALAALSVFAASDGRSVVARTTDADAGWWVVGLAAAVLTAALVLVGESGGAPTDSAEYVGSDDELEDYVRVRTPAVPVELADGSRMTLRQLSGSRAQLLLFVSEGCGSCRDVITLLPQWRNRMPQIDIRLVVSGSPGASSVTSLQEPQTLHDVHGWVRQSFGTGATPSAVLLGVDGHLAGGPVVGARSVSSLVGQMEEQLAPALTVPEP